VGKEDLIDAVANGFGRLNPVFEHRMRFAAGVLLSPSDALSSSRLKEVLGATDGNLGVQMRKLEDAGFVRAQGVPSAQTGHLVHAHAGWPRSDTRTPFRVGDAD
jgi:hypothetical protein